MSLFPFQGRRGENSSFYLRDGSLMVISWTNAALVCLCSSEMAILLLWESGMCVIGIIHIILSANSIQMGFISEGSAGDSPVSQTWDL